MSDEPERYVVDVCGTLVVDDTTLGLLQHHFSKRTERPWRARFLNAVSSRRRPLWWAFAVAERVTGRPLLKRLAVRLLAGERCDALDQSAREYALRLLDGRRIAPVWDVLEAPLANGRVVLASASLEPVVAALATRIGARYVASRLEQRDGCLTGRYATDLAGRKPQALIEKYGEALLEGPIGVVTDNASDRPLAEMASLAYIVLHDAAHRERWQKLDAAGLEVIFIEASPVPRRLGHSSDALSRGR